MQTLDLVVHETYAASASFRRHGEALARRVGQSQANWQVLRAVSTGSLSVSQIARRLGVTRQNVQKIADRLVVQGLVLRVVNIDHKSSPHLALTEKGRRLLDQLAESSDRYRSTLVPLLRELDLNKLLLTLKTLNASLLEVDQVLTKLAPRKARAQVETQHASQNARPRKQIKRNAR